MIRLSSRTICFWTACFVHSLVLAQPTGFQAIAGDVKAPVETSLGECLIESSGRAIVAWDQFSLAAGETLRFHQTGADAAVLNRVLGRESSQLLGSLSSNGAVYVLNPNGIFIGPGAIIQTSGFIASTFDVLDADFLARKSLEFTGDSRATIRNEGTVLCDGDILLLADRVENHGVLAASRGETLVQSSGLEHMFFRVGSQPKVAEATKTRVEGGQIFLVADELCETAGSIETQGGEVRLLGEKVHVLNGSKIDVSAPQGGGTILVGGDYRGENSEVHNAKLTWVGPETELKADATENGNGGKVILWGDEATFHYGKISARGGPEGGDGGFVEVSGPYLDPQGWIDPSAPRGMLGKVLFDPSNITISSGADSGGSFAGCPASFTPSAASSVINATNLVTLLNTPCDVTINTASGSGSAGNITISNAVSWNSTGSLTLTADGSIDAAANVINAGTGGITMTAAGDAGTQWGIRCTATIRTTTGAIVLSGTSRSTSLSIVNPGIVFRGSGLIQATGAGNITLTGNGSTAVASDANDGIRWEILSAVSSVGGNIILTGTGGGQAGSTSAGQGLSTTQVQTSGAGTISLTGVAGPGGGNAGVGVGVFQAQAEGGTVTIHGTGRMVGGGAFGQAYGVQIRDTGTPGVSTTTGKITVTGIGGRGSAGNNHGIELFGTGRVNTSSNGTISLNGTPDPNTASSLAISNDLTTGSITSTSGTILLNNEAGTGTVQVGSSTPSWTTAGDFTVGPNATLLNIGGTDKIQSTAGTLTVNCPMALTANASFTSTTGNMSFSTINGNAAGRTFSANPGSGTLAFTGAIGGTTALGAFSATTTNATASALSAVAITATSIATTANAVGATSTFNGVLTTSGASGVVLSGNVININAGITTTSSGPVTITNTGLLTLAAAADMTVSGAFAQSGGGSVSTAADITTTTTNISFTNAITLTGNVALTSTSGNISLSSTVQATSAGAQNLTVNAGSGTVTLANSVGGSTRLGTLSVSTTNNVTGLSLGNGSSTSTIAADTLTLTGVTNRITLVGDEILDTSAANATITIPVQVNGTSAGTEDLTLLSGSGAITLSSTIGASTRIGAFSATSSHATGLTVTNNITAASFTAASTTNTLFSGASVTINTTAGGISFGGTVNGQSAGSNALTLTTTGAVTLSGNVGATRLGAVIVSSGATGLSIGSAVTSIQANSFTVAGTVPTTISSATPLTVDTSANNGVISFGGNVSQNTTNALTVNGGSGGAVTISGNLTMNEFTVTHSASTTITGTTTVPTVVLTNTTGAVTFNGAATIATALTTAAQGYSVVFNNGGTVTPATTFSNTGGLTLKSGGSPSLSFTNGLTYTAGATTLLGAVTATTNAAAITTGALTCSAGTSSFTTNNGAITTTTITGPGDLTLTSGTAAINLNGNVGSGTPLGAFVISGTSGTTTLPGISVAATSASFGSPVSLTTGAVSVTTTGSGITFSSTVNGTRDLTLTAGTGAIALNGNVGNANALSAFAITGTSGTTTLAGISLAATSAGFGSPVSLTTGAVSVTTTGSGITFSSTVNGTRDLTLTAGTGAIALNGNVGNTNALSAFAITGTSGTTTLAGISVAAASAGFGSPVSLTTGSSSVTTSGGTTFSSTINGARALTLTASGSLTFGGAVGGSTPLTSIVVDAPSISVTGDHTVSQGPMTYGGPVTIHGNTLFTDSGATGITFTSSSTALPDLTVGGITGNFPLTLSALSSTITVNGDIDTSGGTSAADGEIVTMTASGDITVNGEIDTRGGDVMSGGGFDGGDVVITSTGGNITVESIDVSGRSGTMTGGSAGMINLQPGTGFTTTAQGNIPNGKIIFNAPGTITALGVSGATNPGTDGSISLAGAARTGALSVASITSSLAGNDVTIHGGTLSVGVQEAITVLGDLTISMSSSLTLGDVVVLDDYTLTCLSNFLVNVHGVIDLLTFDGTFAESPKAHFVYRGTGTVNGSPTPASSLSQRQTSLSQPAFYTVLQNTLQSPTLILNYDTLETPVPPSPSAGPSAAALAATASTIYNFTVANSEMFYLWEQIPNLFVLHPYKTCFSHSQHPCIRNFPQFTTWLLHNDVR